MSEIESETGNLEGYEFLQRTITASRLQTEARNILDTYSHPWDLLAESLQNSVDAIEQNRRDNADASTLIQIVFNAYARSIEVSDTGAGMSLDQIKSVLAPHQGFKRGKGFRGEKGLGLSFILFMTNRFRIETCDGNETIYLEIHNANNWANGTETQSLKFLHFQRRPPELFHNSAKYTRIWAEQIPAGSIDAGEDIFAYTEPRLRYILRTKTAVGNTFPLFNDDTPPPVNITVQLKYVDNSGVIGEFELVPYSYEAPHKLLRTKEFLTWEDYKERRALDKKIQARALVNVDKATSDSGKEVKWYAFIASRPTFDEISEAHNLLTSDSKDVEAGIHISTRGMPTGIRLTPPRSQQAAYWPSFFILLEYDDLRLDMGRKYVGGRVAQMLTKIALSQIFNAHVNAIPMLTTKASLPFDGLEMDSALEELKNRVANAVDLELKRIPYLKVPLEEQGVVAIFHELLGAGLLKGYRTKHSSAYESYDSFINYKPDRSVLAPSIRKEIKDGANYDIFTEFKFQAGKSLLEDFDLRKRPKDLRLLICWTLDKDAFRKDHIEVEEVDLTETIFHGATHRLIFPNSYGFGAQNTLHVMVLSKVIKTLKDAE